ncbi:MAG: hypothetical protein ACRDGM_20585 [bacterium]
MSEVEGSIHIVRLTDDVAMLTFTPNTFSGGAVPQRHVRGGLDGLKADLTGIGISAAEIGRAIETITKDKTVTIPWVRLTPARLHELGLMQ